MIDYKNPNSFINRLRGRRLRHFRERINGLKPPVKILDVGGTEEFWQTLWPSRRGIRITLLNLSKTKTNCPDINFTVGDARSMGNLLNKSFDVAFSNSVIEHMPNRSDQQKMAEEMRRVGKKYYVQTPNRRFPIEPHFIFPFFQYFPFNVKLWLLTHFNLGNFNRQTNTEAGKTIGEINMLSKKELLTLFPDGEIFEEKFFGLTKSFTIFGPKEDV